MISQKQKINIRQDNETYDSEMVTLSLLTNVLRKNNLQYHQTNHEGKYNKAIFCPKDNAIYTMYYKWKAKSFALFISQNKSLSSW